MKQFRVEDNFQTLQVLGKGAFSTVYKVLRFADNEVYALKRVPFKNLKVKEIQNALNEIRILASVHHPNIVGYRESFIDPTTEDLCVVMNFAGGGDLSSKIKECREKKVRLPENLVIKFFYQLTSALYELHIRNVIHRDLKTANIFLSDDWKNVILGDMNVSKIVKNTFAYTQTGTPYYASPEVWRDEPYSIKTDVWSLGCVIYEMCMLKPPFNATDMDGLFEKVQRCEYDSFDSFYSKPLRESILKLMHSIPECRPNCEKILNFSIFSNLKVLLGENSLNTAPQEPFNYATNQLLETIKPSRDFRDLDHLLPPPQYSFEMQEQGQFSDRFIAEDTRQRMQKNMRKKLEAITSNSTKEDDRFAKKKGSQRVDVESVSGVIEPPNDARSPESKQSSTVVGELTKSQIGRKDTKPTAELPGYESKVHQITSRADNSVRTAVESVDGVRNLKVILPHSAKERLPQEEKSDNRGQLVVKERPIASATQIEQIRVKKQKAELVTINTINSTSNERRSAKERHAFDQHAKNIIKQHRRLNELAAVEINFQGHHSREVASDARDKSRNKPSLLKSNSNLRPEGDHSSRIAPALENVKSLGRDDHKVSKQLVKNKRRVYSGQPPSEPLDIKNSLKTSKKEISQREFLEFFAKQQKADSETDRLLTHKSRSPEFKLRKQTTDKIQTSQKDILGKKRSSSRKPSRVEADLPKKTLANGNAQSVSKNEHSQTSNNVNMRNKRALEIGKSNFENNLKQLNMILKGQSREPALENSKNIDPMLRSAKFGENLQSIGDCNAKLLGQIKKFRIKSSKDRTQVLLNARATEELGNKSDLIVRYLMSKQQRGKTDLEPSELRPHQLRSVMSNAAIPAQKRSFDQEKFSGVDFFTKNGTHGSVQANSGHFENVLGNKSRFGNEERVPNESKFESSLRQNLRQESGKAERVARAPELLTLAVDKSIKITRRERPEPAADDPVPAPKLAQKRASSVGIDKKRVEIQPRKKRGLSNNPTTTAGKKLPKFVLKKRSDMHASDSLRALQGSEHRSNLGPNSLSYNKVQLAVQREQSGKGQPNSAKGLNTELVRSNLIKKRLNKNAQ